MDYEKKYKEALEAMKDCEPDKDGYVTVRPCDIFPELKESGEDKNKRISKEITQFLKQNNGWNREWLTWLEKQSEQKQDPCEHCKDKCLNCYNFPCIDKRTFEQGKTALEAIHEERVDNANKVEPKFHEGEWIISNNKQSTYQVVDVKRGIYIIRDVIDNYEYHIGIDECEKSGRKWTIQDAKDGDVLAYVTDEEDLWIMIYWSLYKPYEGHVHYHALLVNDNFFDKGTCCICIDNLKPATKEQRDLLFAKMREASYEWDEEKKELRKIEKQSESKPIRKLQLSEELYEHIRNTCACIDDALSSETLADIKDYLSMAERSANSAFDMIEKQCKPKWTEEDSLMKENNNLRHECL